MVRAKFRFIVINITPVRKRLETEPFTIKHNDLYKALILMVKNIHGDFGLAAIKTGFTCKYCSDITKVAVVKIRHGPHRFISSAIPLITNVGSTTVQLQTLYTTATLRQAYKYLKRYQQLEFERFNKQYAENMLKLSEEKCLNLKPIEELLASESKET